MCQLTYATYKNPKLCPVKGCRNRRGQNQRICSKHAMRVWRANHPHQAAYAALRGSARKRKISFTITFDEFREFVDQTRYLDFKGCTRYCFHIDRIEVTLGYSRDNIQVLTCTENVIKGNKERRKSFVPYFQNSPETGLEWVDEPEQVSVAVTTETEPF